MVVFPAFYSNKRRKLCFVINVLNNKTIILVNLAEHRLILANSTNGLVGQVSGDIPRDFAISRCIAVKNVSFSRFFLQ